MNEIKYDFLRKNINIDCEEIFLEYIENWGYDVKKVKVINTFYKKIFNKEPPSFSLDLQPTYQGATLTMSYAFN